MIFLLPLVVSWAVALPLVAAAGVAVIDLQQAVGRTQEGRRRIAALQAAAAKRQDAIRKMEVELTALRSRLTQASDLLNAAAYSEFLRQIRRKARQLEREVEDAQSELADEERRIFEEIGGPMLALISRYAQDHGYVLVLNATSPAARIVWAAPAVQITDEIVRLYDDAHPPGAAPIPSAHGRTGEMHNPAGRLR